MAQKISQMTEQTTASMTEAGTSDFLGGYTATGGNANRKFSLSGLANYFLNKFKITLGGSSQTVKSAIDALNSNAYLLTGGTKINAAFDFDSLSTPGNYYVDGSVAATHSPVTTNITGLIKVEHTVGHADEYLRQTYYPYRATGGYYTRVRNNSVWGSWVLQPTREEIVSINGKQSDTAGFHNGIYRGKNITSYLTDGTLWNRIKGTGGYALFADLYLGDYITVGSNSYAIVDFDYYLRCGNVDLNEHHIVMMPTGNMNIPEGTALYGVSGKTLQFINTANAGVTVSSQESATGFKWNAKMSDPNTHNTNGGYKYSRMRQIIMKAANTIVVNAFGSSHVKPITVLYPNPSSETASGVASGWAWFDNDDQSAADAKSLCDLPNETQIYGQQVWGRGSVYTNMGYEAGTDKFQFAICALQRNFVDTRADWWLRSVLSASNAADVISYGIAVSDGTAYALGVRPRFLLVG